ncbi:MAG: hypothetical protein ABIF77_16060 [bacterium]
MSPRLGRVSGLYTREIRAGDDPLEVFEYEGDPDPALVDLFSTPNLLQTDWKLQLRLDVDGPLPLNIASLTCSHLTIRVHWIARLTRQGPQNIWAGPIIYRHGLLQEPLFHSIRITVEGILPRNEAMARVAFRSHWRQEPTILLRFKSQYFREAAVEVDHTSDWTDLPPEVDPEIVPGNFPAEMSVPSPVTIRKAFKRAGIDVDLNVEPNPITYSEADFDTTNDSDSDWNDAELHGALEKCWSLWADKPQWALWAFYTHRHENLSNYGIMFDVSGHHRQGAAIFSKTFEDLYTGNMYGFDADTFKKRSKLFVSVHEIGHTFNLAHSWQKVSGTMWMPLANDDHARSFMNYPWRGGAGTNIYEREKDFYQTFEYRFTDDELLFLRHAPGSFVQMGNAAWDTHHAAGIEASGSSTGVRLQLGLGRADGLYHFLEPVYLDLALLHLNGEPQLVDAGLLAGGHSLNVVVQRDGQPARRFSPLVEYHQVPSPLGQDLPVLQSLLVSAHRDGWLLDEPGNYSIQARLDLGGEELVSEPVRLRIQTPLNRREEEIALDYFTPAVGRVLTFQGSRDDSLASSMDVLRTIVTDPELQNSRVAFHAEYALNRVLARPYKRLSVPETARSTRELLRGRRIELLPGQPELAQKALTKLLINDLAPERLGFIQFANRCLWFRRWLLNQEQSLAAENVFLRLREVENVAPYPLVAPLSPHWSEVTGRKDEAVE